MTLGARDFWGSIFLCQVAGYTQGAGHENLFVRPFRHLGRSVYNGFDKHHVFFIQGRVVAGMTVDALVHAGLPAVKRIFHEVTAQAELGIIFGVVVEMQGADTHSHNHQSDQKTDHDFKFNGTAIV